MKYHFHRDTFFATIFLLVLLWVLSATIKSTLLEPGKVELHDFDYTDLVYSLSGPAPSRFDTSIVIVNTGDTDRAGIAAVISRVKQMHPSVIGVDILFHGERGADSLMEAAIAGTPNLVMGTALDEGHHENERFRQLAAHNAFVNFYGEKGNVVRYCLPFRGKDTSFAAALLRIADPAAFDKLCTMEREEQPVNYSRRDTEFLVIDHRQLLAGEVDSEMLRNKIVLVGFYSYDPYNIEDKLLTPKNPVFIGRSLPDMHGIAIHANILSMMRGGSYIHVLPAWVDHLLAILMGWLCTGIFIRYAARHFRWIELMVKLWQGALLFVLLAVHVLLFKYCRIKADITLAVVLLFFSAEVLFLYEMLALWLAERFDHKTVFKKH